MPVSLKLGRVGIALLHATFLSGGFCGVHDIVSGGPADRSGLNKLKMENVSLLFKCVFFIADKARAKRNT
jgi:hypothetical protein